MIQILLGFILLVCFAQVSLAARPNIEDRLQDQIIKEKEKLIQADRDQRKVLSNLYDINRKIKRLVREKSDLEYEQMNLVNSNRELAQKIVEIEAKIKQQKDLLRSRIYAIHKMGGAGAIQLLMSSNGSADLERNLKIIGLIAKQDLDLIQDYVSNVKSLQIQKQRLQNRIDRLNKNEKKIRNREQILLTENDQKNRILDAIKQKTQKTLKSLDQIRQIKISETDISETGILDGLFMPSFFERKGQLPWPMPGQIVRGFGLSKLESSQLTFANKGVVIRSSVLSPVKAVFDGKVSYLNEIEGIGTTIIIDHGDHYYSVYSKLSDVSVSDGQQVSQGQTLAKTQTDELYFEVRHFSQPYDPQVWMKGTPL